MHISLSLFPLSGIPLFSSSSLILGTLHLLKDPPTAGLAGLEKLSIIWAADDNPNEPGSSLAHLYELIRPTLNTLVELRIDNDPEVFHGNFDQQLLKPTADTLGTFEYTLQSADESILDTIPAILPRLTKLNVIWVLVIWENLFMKHSILWKACTKFSTSHSMILMILYRMRISKLSRKIITLLT